MVEDAIGDRCKDDELAEAGRRAMRGLPLRARLDGGAFHTFTRGTQVVELELPPARTMANLFERADPERVA